jgi:hypothetical protein
MFGAPWLHPWPDAALKVCDDLIGDALIEVAFHGFLLVSGLQLLLQPELGPRQ